MYSLTRVESASNILQLSTRSLFFFLEIGFTYLSHLENRSLHRYRRAGLVSVMNRLLKLAKQNINTLTNNSLALLNSISKITLQFVMKIIVKIIAALIAIAGLTILLKPAIILEWIEINAPNQVLYFSAIVSRTLIGITLILAAKHSRFPTAIKVLGIITLVAAIVFMFVGHENFKHFMTNMIPRIKSYAPVSGIIGIAVGAFLFYAVSNKG